MTPRETLLEVEGLCTYFGGGAFRGRRRKPVRAVDGVSFNIGRGETVAVVGESGCGKTTLARTVVGLVPATSGSVRFDGQDVRSLRGAALRDLRRRVQIVFQDPLGSLNPRLTVGRALAEVLQVHGITDSPPATRDRVGALLDQVGLGPGHARRLPHELSGGQRQRVGIARALAVEPEFLVLDEPVSALDVSVRAQVINLLADLQERLGLTYLLIAHDLALVEHVSDRVAVMYRGRIVELAQVDDLYGHPLHPYTRDLLNAVPQPVVPDPENRPRPADSAVIPASEPPFGTGGCPYGPRCRHPARDHACAAGVPPLVALGKGRFVACVKESSDTRTRG